MADVSMEPTACAPTDASTDDLLDLLHKSPEKSHQPEPVDSLAADLEKLVN